MFYCSWLKYKNYVAKLKIFLSPVLLPMASKRRIIYEDSNKDENDTAAAENVVGNSKQPRTEASGIFPVSHRGAADISI